MISIHDIIAFIEYEKYFQSVERAEEEKARAAIAAPAPDPARLGFGGKTRGFDCTILVAFPVLLR